MSVHPHQGAKGDAGGHGDGLEKGLKVKHRCKFWELILGDILPVFPGEGQRSYPKGSKCGSPHGGGSCLAVHYSGE